MDSKASLASKGINSQATALGGTSRASTTAAASSQLVLVAECHIPNIRRIGGPSNELAGFPGTPLPSGLYRDTVEDLEESGLVERARAATELPAPTRSPASTPVRRRRPASSPALPPSDSLPFFFFFFFFFSPPPPPPPPWLWL